MPDTVGRLAPNGLHALLSAGKGLTVLDVREPFERAYCAIEVPAPARDLFVPMGQVQARFEEIRDALNGESLVIYCHHGVRSLAVANWLVGQGCARVFNLDGGIDAWSILIDPETPRY
jgi:rhodanese-related sulfurtransferase